MSMPPGRQIAEASARRCVTSVGDTSGPATTLTRTGGANVDPESAGASAGSGTSDAAAIKAAARPVAISIMPAVDASDRQKFDVRIRDERTVLNVEIDRY